MKVKNLIKKTAIFSYVTPTGGQEGRRRGLRTELQTREYFFSTGESIRNVTWRALWLSSFALFELHLSFPLFERDSGSRDSKQTLKFP